MKFASENIRDLIMTDYTGRLVKCYPLLSDEGKEIYLRNLDLCPGVYYLVLNNIVKKPFIVCPQF